MYEVTPSEKKCRKMLKQICNLKKKGDLTNEEILKVEKYRYYWDIYNNNYTKALPYELQNIILSYIDPNTRIKIIKATYYKKIKSIIGDNITENATSSQLYAILKHIMAFQKCGIFVVPLYNYNICISFNEFQHEFRRRPAYMSTYFKSMLPYLLKNYTSIYKTIDDKKELATLEIRMKKLYLHILRLK